MKFNIIKNFSKYSISEKGKVKNIRQDKLRKFNKTKKGYLKVCIYSDLGKMHNLPVHRLVWETYKGKIKGIINHKDLDKTNNHIDNLEDITVRENNLHWIKNTEKKFKSKFTGLRKKKNGYFRARLMYRGKVYETDRKKEEDAFQWYLDKCKELGISTKYVRG